MGFSDFCLNFILAHEAEAGKLSDAAREEAADDGGRYDEHVDAIGRLAARVARGVDDASGERDPDAVGRLFGLAEAVMHARCAPPPHSDAELGGAPDELRQKLVEFRRTTMALYRRADALAAAELRPPFPSSAFGLDGREVDALIRACRARDRDAGAAAHRTGGPAKALLARALADAAAAAKHDGLRRSFNGAAAKAAGLHDFEAERLLGWVWSVLDRDAGAYR